jgi:hypothetical protein
LTAVALLGLLLLPALMSGAPGHLIGSPAAPAVHVDMSRQEDLAGNGQIQKVDWYSRGPLSPECPRCPSGDACGVSVWTPDHKRRLARWESPHPSSELSPCAIPWLSGLWRFPETKGYVILDGVRYGGSTLHIYALRFRQGKLRQVADVGGRRARVKRMGQPPRPVLVVTPSNYDELYALYAWDGATFSRADRKFPDFWLQVGKSFAKDVAKPASRPLFIFGLDCRRAVRAYRLAGRRALARQVCVQARARVAAAQNAAADGSPKSERDFERERKSVLQAIDTSLARL